MGTGELTGMSGENLGGDGMASLSEGSTDTPSRFIIWKAR